jgi:hypothetical protein
VKSLMIFCVQAGFLPYQFNKARADFPCLSFSSVWVFLREPFASRLKQTGNRLDVQYIDRCPLAFQ